MMSIRKIGFIFLLITTLAFSTEKKNSPEIMVSRLKKHVSFLASDELQGRQTGSAGDSLAAEYIRNNLIDCGLIPLFEKGFERFRVTDKIIYGPQNKLTINTTSPTNLNLILHHLPFHKIIYLQVKFFLPGMALKSRKTP